MQVKHWIAPIVTLILLGFSVLAADPVMQSSRIAPNESVYTNSSLIGYCNGTDADNDSIKYEFIWYRNGTQWATGFLVNNTVSSYQETADSITASHSEMYDGDWTTYPGGVQSIEENYTIPFYGVGWQWIRGSTSSNYTYENIDACRYAFPDKILFLAQTTNLFGGSRAEYCWNGTAWQVLLANTFYEPISETAINWEEFPALNIFDLETEVSKVMQHNTAKLEDWTFSCRVSDGGANSSWLNSSVVSILDAPPSIQSANISPTGVTGTEQDLVGYCQASDIDGDLINYEYNWTRNGVSNQTGIIYNVTSGTYQNVANISSSSTFSSDSWVLYCRAVSTTGTDNSSWLASAATNISNPGPNVTYISPADGTDVSDPVSIVISVHDDNANVSEVNITARYPNGTIFYQNNSGVLNQEWYNITIQLTGLSAYGRYVINTTTRDTIGDGYNFGVLGVDYIIPYLNWYDDFANSNFSTEQWSVVNWLGTVNAGVIEVSGFVEGINGGNGATMSQNFSQTKGIRFDKDFRILLNYSKGTPLMIPGQSIYLIFSDNPFYWSATDLVMVGLSVESFFTNADLNINCLGACSCTLVTASGIEHNDSMRTANIFYNQTTGVLNYSRDDGPFVNTTISGCNLSEMYTIIHFRQGTGTGPNAQNSRVYDFWAGTVCTPNITCTSYGSCSGHIQQCLAANDSNDCGTTINLSTLAIPCNSNPNITVAVNNTSPLFNSTIKCTINMSDPDGDNASTTEYQWVNNGLNISTATSQDLIINNLSYYNLTCNGRVNDSYGGSSGWTPSSNYAIVANTPPVISNVLLGPTPAYINTPLVCNWSYSDINLDLENSSIVRWYVDNVLIKESTSSSQQDTLSSSSYTGGDIVRCSVKGYDGKNYSASYVDSNNITISNSAPTFTSVTITPSVAYRSSTLTCTVSGATDPDGDSITKYYQFRDSDNITILQNYSSDNTLVCNSTASCTKGDTIYCLAYVSDGSLNSSVLSTTRNISGALPVAKDVFIYPYTPRDNDTLECNYTYFDADGDAESSVSYRWFVNGSLHGNTLKTLNAGFTTDEEKWACEVKVNDGSDGLPVNSTEVYVGKQNPQNIIVSSMGIADETAGSITFYWTWTDPQLPTGGPYTHYICNGSSINTSGCQGSTTICTVTDDVSPSQCTYTIPAGAPTNNTYYWLIKDGANLTSTIAAHSWVFNHKPTVANLSLNVTSNGIYNIYSCLLSDVSDIDGDETLTTYAFYASNGTVLQSYSGTNTYIINTGAATRGDNIICRARAFDDRIYSTEINGTDSMRVSSISYSSTAFVDSFTTISATLSNDTNPIGVNLTIRDPFFVQFSDIPMVYNNATDKWAYSFAPNIVGQWVITKVYAVDSDGQSYVYKGSADVISVTTQQGGSGGGGGGETTIREIPVIGNITGFCGDGVCQEGENPSNCWSDCRVNYDTLITCLWDDDVQCNWQQSWFPLALIGFLGVVAVVSLFLSANKPQRGRK